MTATVEGYATLVDMPGIYPVVGFGQHWNGWATPAFSPETGREIVAALAAWYQTPGAVRPFTSADGVEMFAVCSNLDPISDAQIALAQTMTENALERDFLPGTETVECWSITTPGWAAWCWDRHDTLADAQALAAEMQA